MTGSSRNFRNSMRGNLILEAINAATSPLSPLSIIATSSAQTCLNTYSFFAGCKKASKSLPREQIARISLAILDLCQLVIASYLLFENQPCAEPKDNLGCKILFFVSALKIGLEVFVAAGSELNKRGYQVEQLIEENDLHNDIQGVVRAPSQSPAHHHSQGIAIPHMIIDHSAGAPYAQP